MNYNKLEIILKKTFREGFLIGGCCSIPYISLIDKLLKEDYDKAFIIGAALLLLSSTGYRFYKNLEYRKYKIEEIE